MGRERDKIIKQKMEQNLCCKYKAVYEKCRRSSSITIYFQCTFLSMKETARAPEGLRSGAFEIRTAKTADRGRKPIIRVFASFMGSYIFAARGEMIIIL